MSAELLRPPGHLSPGEALRLSQQAPTILQKQSAWPVPWPLSLLTTSDAPEKWTIYENLFYACLRTGDDKSASLCLLRLKERFGETNERVMGLVGLFHEANATNDAAVAGILKSYETAISENPTNMVVRKRHVALLKSIGRLGGATSALVDLVDASPIDAEAWTELSDLYLAQGLYQQAIFSLEETLLVTPNAWNIHAKLAEVFYMVSASSQGSDIVRVKSLTRAMKSFCRSIELCDDYLRGYYGLKFTTNQIKTVLSKAGNQTVMAKETAEDDIAIPSLSTVQSLNELATSKLGDIIRKSSTATPGWTGYDESEIIAARALLDRDTETITR